MKRNNYYDVTDWQVGNPYTDIGEVINSIIAQGLCEDQRSLQ